MKHLNPAFDTLGFKDTASFVESTFHPNNINFSLIMSSIFGCIAYFIETFLGFESMVAVAIIMLFTMEITTGIKASLKEGECFSSKKLGRGFLKMMIYMLMIGSANLLAQHIHIKPILGWTFNYYEWIHYTCMNFVILQLFISNIENFNRLGWTEFVPLLKKLSKLLKLK